jgi:hypothetical protein
MDKNMMLTAWMESLQANGSRLNNNLMNVAEIALSFSVAFDGEN